MAFVFCAAAGSPATTPRSAISSVRALLVAMTSDVADCRPRLLNCSADPAYSGTSWIRPLISAGSTSSRLPRPGRTRTGKPFAFSASPYM